jgi:hypothetical protein
MQLLHTVRLSTSAFGTTSSRIRTMHVIIYISKPFESWADYLSGMRLSILVESCRWYDVLEILVEINAVAVGQGQDFTGLSRGVPHCDGFCAKHEGSRRFLCERPPQGSHLRGATEELRQTGGWGLSSSCEADSQRCCPTRDRGGKSPPLPPTHITTTHARTHAYAHTYPSPHHVPIILPLHVFLDPAVAQLMPYSYLLKWSTKFSQLRKHISSRVSLMRKVVG